MNAAPEPIKQLIAQKTANVTSDKKAKADVNYRTADEPDTESCGICHHFDGTNNCNVVAGHIRPDHVSDLFTPAAQPSNVGNDGEPPPGPDYPDAEGDTGGAPD